MSKILLVVSLGLALSGCAYSIKDVDTSKANPDGVRQCLNNYSQCAAGGPAVGFKTEQLRACKEAYELCIQSFNR